MKNHLAQRNLYYTYNTDHNIGNNNNNGSGGKELPSDLNLMSEETFKNVPMRTSEFGRFDAGSVGSSKGSSYRSNNTGSRTSKPSKQRRTIGTTTANRLLSMKKVRKTKYTAVTHPSATTATSTTPANMTNADGDVIDLTKTDDYSNQMNSSDGLMKREALLRMKKNAISADTVDDMRVESWKYDSRTHEALNDIDLGDDYGVNLVV